MARSNILFKNENKKNTVVDFKIQIKKINNAKKNTMTVMMMFECVLRVVVVEKKKKKTVEIMLLLNSMI